MNKDALLACAAILGMLGLGIVAGCGKSDLTPMNAPSVEPTNPAATVPIGGPAGRPMSAPVPSGFNTTPRPAAPP